MVYYNHRREEHDPKKKERENKIMMKNIFKKNTKKAEPKTETVYAVYMCPLGFPSGSKEKEFATEAQALAYEAERNNNYYWRQAGTIFVTRTETKVMA